MKTLILILFTTICFSQDSKIGFMLINENTIELDKQQHFVAGSIIALPTYIVSRYELNLSRRNSVLLSVGVASLVGLIKELSDKKTTGFDTIDLLYTTGGGLFMSLTLDLTIKHKNK